MEDLEVVQPTTQVERNIAGFLNAVWGDGVGYACIASRSITSEQFGEQFFHFPEQLPEIARYVHSLDMYDVWYCPQLFTKPARRKKFAKCCECLWADLDTCDPNKLLLQPSFLIKTSPGRWQGIWTINEPTELEVLQDYSKRIAYYHAKDGADKSGWDITQLLRVPGTHNFKYESMPEVLLETVGPSYNRLSDFDVYPLVDDTTKLKQYDFPKVIPDSTVLLENNKAKIHPAAHVLLSREPKDDWSKALWHLETLLFESKLSRTEVYAIASASPCNKYDRDQRGEMALWREVCRAASHVAAKNAGEDPEDFVLGPMLTEPERVAVMQAPSIVTDYIAMASEMTDAAPQFHQAGIFTLLSAMLAGSVTVEADFGEIMPNLWFLILASTTLSRKTTTMDIAMEILSDIDDDAVLATDGSIEGMIGALADRNHRSSIFLRDEFAGLIEMMQKKDHYAGMLETFAKLYDGKAQKKILRRQTIDIKKPVFLIYAGGIKSRILQLFIPHHIDSGFLPRFVFVSAETDLGALRPLGPKRAVVREKRDRIVARLKNIKTTYDKMQVMTIAGVQVPMPKKTEVELTPEAWIKYQFYEAMMNADAANSGISEFLTPMFTRLTVTGLKVAVLLAAARCSEAGCPVEVDEVDILESFYYVEQWRKTAYEVVTNIGRSGFELQIESAVKFLKDGDGVGSRGLLMRKLKLSARQAHDLVETMEQRNMIVKSKSGMTEMLTLLEGSWKIKT